MKKRKSSIKILAIILGLIVVLCGVFVALLYQKTKDVQTAQSTIATLQSQIETNKMFVYVASEDLKKGTVLEEGVNVEVQEAVTALPSVLYLQEDDMGKTLTVDVAAYEPIMASMVTAETLTQDMREVEIGVAHLMVDQQNLDYVDIRIMFPNGEDYVVIPKVKVNNLLLENSIFYTALNESEILTLASATIDAYTISGAKIYTTRYIESNLQEESIANYPVRGDILSLIATDPNILEVAQETLNYQAREAINEKLSKLDEEFLKSVVAGHGITDSANNTAFNDRISQEKLEAETAQAQEGANE